MTKTTTNGAFKLSALLIGSMLMSAVSAATTITIDKVAQRWPWNNKIDITYSIKEGGQDVSKAEYYKIVFTTVINGTTYTIDGSSVGASANKGTHTVTWTAPSGIRSKECTMTATVAVSDVPSGDDYMIIDLTKTSDNVTYEGLFATQEESNKRYNIGNYKNSTRILLRKVPAGTHFTGSAKYGQGDNMNTKKYWTTDRAYYIGVFPVTQDQYKKVCGTNPSNGASDSTAQRPVTNVSWDDLRLASTAATSPIPTVNSQTGTFFQRLNFITGNKFGFDLPTEAMFEIAQRAGVEGDYSWGDDNSLDTIKQYAVCASTRTTYVGSKKPNNWGLYDTAGNVWELCLDGYENSNMADRLDVFTPTWVEGESKRARRGGGSYEDDTVTFFRAARRSGGVACTDRQNAMGFRVAMIVD